MFKAIVVLLFPFFVCAQVPVFKQDTLLLITPVKSESIRLTGLYGFYKRFISSQDGQVCTFYPSCSLYSKGAIRKNGLLIGLFLTADRLCRCNGHSDNGYEYRPEDGKPIDLP